ncbi:MAG: DNA repair protein RecO [Xanthomonadaceae bacterium]|nr:DNA repair protein RecO [Xanthomonadaceae bacterium]MDE1963594.1 DNA repair protein RecO [Xanthomonadaceae bacterium]
MRVDQQPAFVLHARAYRETSLLLECLTRDHGRIGVIARGVRSERGRSLRATLEPFQPLAMDLLLRGELATLRAAEPAGPARRLGGDVGLAGLYLNELLVRLTGRQDPQPGVFDAYAITLARLANGEPPGWTLRRFERDLLAALGYQLVLEHESGTAQPLRPEAHYRYRAESGPEPCAGTTGGTLLGAWLLALAADVPPEPAGQHALRGMMRELIRFHLGGGELRSWHVLAGGSPVR